MYTIKNILCIYTCLYKTTLKQIIGFSFSFNNIILKPIFTVGSKYNNFIKCTTFNSKLYVQLHTKMYANGDACSYFHV